MPGVQGAGQGVPPVLGGKVHDHRGAPRQGRPGAGGEVIGGLVGQAGVHLEVGVGVNEAGEDELAPGVNHPVGLQVGQVAPQGSDFALVDIQIAHHRAVGQHQTAALNESWHGISLLLKLWEKREIRN